jgi:hypothetical protein
VTSILPTSNFQTDTATVFSVQPNTVSSRVYASAIAGFVQDNYKATRRLTIEAGLRYEWNGTPVEGANRFTIFNPAEVTLTQVGTNGLPRQPYNQNNNFEPRAGFAWDVFGTGRTVLRGGYGYLVDQPVSGVVTPLASNPPFSTAVSYNGAAIPVSQLFNDAKASGIALAMVNPKFSNAYIETYNLNLQQAVPWGMVASLYYVGSEGKHLLIQTNANQVVGPTSNTQVHPFTKLASSSPIDPGGAIASNIGERNSIGLSNYNALWAVLTKNMGNGLSFSMNYEWSKSMDLNSLGSQGTYVLPDSNNPKENYGLSDFDTRNHFALYALYDLPFKGNRWKEGFQLSGIMQYQTGNPVNILSSSNSFNGITGIVRPNLVGPISKRKVQASGVTNVNFITNVPGVTTCFESTLTPACTFETLQTTPTSGIYTGLGDIQRNAVTGPGYADLDLSGEKDTKITERLQFQLRADAFDIINHPNFGQPSGNVQATTFGQISSTRFAVSDGGSSRQLQISGKFVF